MVIYSSYSYLEISLINVVCIYDTFENNSRIKINFAKYLKKSCRDVVNLFMPRDFSNKSHLHL